MDFKPTEINENSRFELDGEKKKKEFLGRKTKNKIFNVVFIAFRLEVVWLKLE